MNVFLYPFKLTFGIEFMLKKILLEDYLEMNLTELDWIELKQFILKSKVHNKNNLQYCF